MLNEIEVYVLVDCYEDLSQREYDSMNILGVYTPSTEGKAIIDFNKAVEKCKKDLNIIDDFKPTINENNIFDSRLEYSSPKYKDIIFFQKTTLYSKQPFQNP